MNKRITFFALIICCFSIAAFSQDTIVGWTFQNGTAGDRYANLGTVENNGLSDIRATSNNDISRELSYYAHDDNYTLEAQEWSEGTDFKFWRIGFKALQYKDIRISSLQRSDGVYCGPRDFKLQYKLNYGEWHDIENGNVTVENNWQTGIVESLPLPSECNGYPNNIYIRWIMTSDSSAYGTIINEEGKSWIDNVIVTGTYVEPNPQPIIAGWTFPNAFSSDHTPDTCTTANAEFELEYWDDDMGGTINYFLAGGYSSFSAKGVDWSNGNDMKYWMIKLKTEGYQNINISSRQASSESKPGPVEFKVQYKIGGDDWYDLENATISVDTDWDTGKLDAVLLPVSCWDTTASVYIRWIATTNLDFNGNNLSANSTSYIDDIIVRGEIETSGIDEFENIDISIFPIPAHNFLIIDSEEQPTEISIFTINGKLIKTVKNPEKRQKINISDFNTGLYFVSINYSGQSISKKFIIE